MKKNYCNCPNCQTLDCPAGIELADLILERAQLRPELNAAGGHIAMLNSKLTESAAMLMALRHENEALCADKERMDWLCSLTSVIGYWYGHKKFDTRTPDGLIPLRPAIDAAKGNK